MHFLYFIKDRATISEAGAQKGNISRERHFVLKELKFKHVTKPRVPSSENDEVISRSSSWVSVVLDSGQYWSGPHE